MNTLFAIRCKQNFSRVLLAQKVGTVILTAAFTDHAVVISTEKTTFWRNRKKWKVSSTVLSDESSKNALSNKWKEWRQAKNPISRGNYMVGAPREKRLEILSRQNEAGKRRDTEGTESYLNTCIYDIPKCELQHSRKRQLLQQYKAEIIRIHSNKHGTIMPDKRTRYTQRRDDTTPNNKNTKKRIIHQIRMTHGTDYRHPMDINRVLYNT
jgi:hypothetical protein